MNKIYSGRIVDAVLCKKGFLRESDGDHIRYFLPNATGTDWIVRTKISHDMKGSTIDAWLLSQMARQLRLTKKQFLDLIDCTLDEDSYREMLRKEDLAV